MKRMIKIWVICMILGTFLSGCSVEDGKVKLTVELEVDGLNEEESEEEPRPRQAYDPELDIWYTDIRYGVQDENGNIIWD